MKQINSQRAKLVCSEYPDGNCSMEPTDVVQRYLKNCPSIIEKSKCKNKGCASKIHELNLPVLQINESEFKGNFENLASALMLQFPEENLCRKCRKPCHSFERIIGHHLFIEVIHICIFQNISNELNNNFFFFRFQMLKINQILIMHPAKSSHCWMCQRLSTFSIRILLSLV